MPDQMPEGANRWDGQSAYFAAKQEKTAPITPTARRKKLRITTPIAAHKQVVDLSGGNGLAADFVSEPTDPAIDLINSEPNPNKRQALLIAYSWAKGRSDKGITKADFLNRAKNERKCEYLKDNRDEIWEELEVLIS